MPSTDNSLAAFDRLNLNDSDVISHLCSVAVEKCQSKQERRLAGCGGHHMRKRVLIKNFVSELMKKQETLQDGDEDGMEEEEEEEEEEDEEIELEEEDEGAEEEEVHLNEMKGQGEGGDEWDEEEEEEEEEEGDEDGRETKESLEWYHPQHQQQQLHAAYQMPSVDGRGYGSNGGYSSPSPPLDEDDKREWSLPACTSPDSMALHLRDPYEIQRGAGGIEAYQSCDPYSFSSSFSLSPPSDDENSHLGSPVWHDTHLSSSYLVRPPSRLDCSPPYSIYDDLYPSSGHHVHHSPSLTPPAETTTLLHHTQLLDVPYPSSSSIRVVAAGESDAAFLAMGGELRPLEEMRSYSLLESSSSSESILFDLSSPSSAPSSVPSTPSKKRRSSEISAPLPCPPLLLAMDDDHSKRIKL